MRIRMPAFQKGRRHLSFLGLTVLIGCAGPQIRTDVAMIYLTATPETALVLVDDVPIGRVDQLREHITVPSGSHRLEVRADGYISYRSDVVLEGGESYGLIVELWPTIGELDQ